MTTRFLLCCITSNYYDGEKTLDDLHAAISQDAQALYHTGFKAPGLILIPCFPLQVGSETLRMVCTGVKGDWPYIRKAPRQHSERLQTLPVPLVPEAMHLNSGFNCTAKCHLCDAEDWHRFDEGASWRFTVGVNRSCSPFWDVEIPLLAVPGICATTILPDSTHCFHLGWGVDYASSGLVLLAKKQCFPGRRTVNNQLYEAYVLFTAWCSSNGKTTAIQRWDTKKLDMTTRLVCI